MLCDKIWVCKNWNNYGNIQQSFFIQKEKSVYFNVQKGQANEQPQTNLVFMELFFATLFSITNFYEAVSVLFAQKIVFQKMSFGST